MRELILTAEIAFLEIASYSYGFPIRNNIRLSFWLPESNASTFSELQIQNNDIYIGKEEVVKIKLVERDFLLNKIKRGTEFRLGTFPNEIAIGKVINVGNVPIIT